MFQGTRSGIFWLSDRPERTVDGTLNVDDKGRLELTTRGLLDLDDNEGASRTVCGATPDGHVTLVDALHFNPSHSVNRYLPVASQETWCCSYAFQGEYERHHISEGIVAVEVEIQSLSDWAREGLNLRLDQGENNLSWFTESFSPVGEWSLGEVATRNVVPFSTTGRAGRPFAFSAVVRTSFAVKFSQAQSLAVVQDAVSSLQALVLQRRV